MHTGSQVFFLHTKWDIKGFRKLPGCEKGNFLFLTLGLWTVSWGWNAGAKTPSHPATWMAVAKDKWGKGRKRPCSVRSPFWWGLILIPLVQNAIWHETVHNSPGASNGQPGPRTIHHSDCKPPFPFVILYFVLTLMVPISVPSLSYWITGSQAVHVALPNSRRLPSACCWRKQQSQTSLGI